MPWSIRRTLGITAAGALCLAGSVSAVAASAAPAHLAAGATATPTPELLNNNPNQAQPQRLTSSEALTCDQTTTTRPSNWRLTVA